MAGFWSLIDNEKYRVGCTGQTVYVYDTNGTELAKFKDLTYAYTAAFSPKGDIFVVKTTEGRLAVYSLETLCLIKKFRFSKVDGSQDDNFCFSSDGENFYNIERHMDSCKTALSIYRTKDFSLEKRLFETDNNPVLGTIEYDDMTDTFYILGFFRNQIGCASKYFVAKLCDDALKDIEDIPQDEYTYYSGYKNLEFMGFTKKAKEWSSLKYEGYDLSDIENIQHSLAELWQYHALIKNS